MDSITAIEIVVSVMVIISCCYVVLFLSGKAQKLGFILTGILVVGMLSFFVIRPYYIDHQVNLKTTQLNQYLTNKYPKETWTIQRQVSNYQNPYHLKVVFENEPEWTYTYKVIDQRKILLTSYSSTSQKGSLEESKHFKPFE